jgi:hypothetical protein
MTRRHNDAHTHQLVYACDGHLEQVQRLRLEQLAQQPQTVHLKTTHGAQNYGKISIYGDLFVQG